MIQKWERLYHRVTYHSGMKLNPYPVKYDRYKCNSPLVEYIKGSFQKNVAATLCPAAQPPPGCQAASIATILLPASLCTVPGQLGPIRRACVRMCVHACVCTYLCVHSACVFVAREIHVTHSGLPLLTCTLLLKCHSSHTGTGDKGVHGLIQERQKEQR